MAANPLTERVPTKPLDLLRGQWRKVVESSSGAIRKLATVGEPVALTFDDGPDPRFTPAILDALDRSGVKATFFFLGERAKAHPEIVKRAASGGHAVGSHSFGHAGPSKKTVRLIASDYQRGREAIEEIVGKNVQLFRPPYGTMTARSVLAMRRVGLKPWLWSAEASDWRAGVSAEQLLRSLSTVSAGDIVLLHDGVADRGPGIGEDRWATVEMIEQLVKTLTERGMTFITLDGGVSVDPRSNGSSSL
jgi:peptidoglycan-N-acetylglucosamine deacetylase